MAQLVVAVNPRVKFSEDQISAILDEVFCTYAEFILPDGKGLSLQGLLRTYDDGAGDVDRDFLLRRPPLPRARRDQRPPRVPADSSRHLQVQFQDAVLCKILAKRGCATHPRSIAKQVRRTKISERIRKLQELVPNMDKQTNTSDMLDLAVDYIKDL
ncbi:transcription factor RAU1 [Panicum miliaceum]|uniref:Transcription factor RAU1 n=1 Tax=Panicum miliaceum TaxID=4540 RepID=A0A3L6SVG2_PANMI|nr:transcription factor RAU1 [Panicum miliaceum]